MPCKLKWVAGVMLLALVGATAWSDNLDLKHCAQQKVAFDGIQPLKYADITGETNAHIPLWREHPVMCTSADEAKCKGKAYLIPGNTVAVANTCGDYSHVQYIGEKTVSYGWVENAYLVKQQDGSKVTPVSIASAIPESARTRWKMIVGSPGDDANLCNALLARLNAFPGHCSHDAIETYPEFQTLQWRDMDPSKYVDLLVKLDRYGQVGATRYFSDSKWAPSESYRSLIKGYIKRGLSLQVTHIHLFNHNPNSKLEASNENEQTAVLVTHKPGTASSEDDNCPGQTSHNWIRSTYIVLSDLSGPDPRVDDGTRWELSAAWPVRYHGEIVLISGLYYKVYQQYQPGGLITVCSYEQEQLKSRAKKRGN